MELNLLNKKSHLNKIALITFTKTLFYITFIFSPLFFLASTIHFWDNVSFIFTEFRKSLSFGGIFYTPFFVGLTFGLFSLWLSFYYLELVKISKKYKYYNNKTVTLMFISFVLYIMSLITIVIFLFNGENDKTSYHYLLSLGYFVLFFPIFGLNFEVLLSDPKNSKKGTQ